MKSHQGNNHNTYLKKEASPGDNLIVVRNETMPLGLSQGMIPIESWSQGGDDSIESWSRGG